MNMLESGYALSFDRSYLPDSYEEDNNMSAKADMSFVREEVDRLLEKGCIVRSMTQPLSLIHI